VVVLTGRATSVPFTAVMNSPERTTTDKTTAAVTCADHRFSWWRSCSIWLCKQGVEACVGLAPAPLTDPVLVDDVSGRLISKEDHRCKHAVAGARL